MSEDFDVRATHMAREVLGMMRPHRLVGADKVRVGRFFDGGYVMVDRFEDVRVAYSLGINDDVSWDLDIANRDVDIYQYDHTIAALPREHPRFHWHKIGIALEADPSGPLETLPALIAANGHERRTDMLLKCDIEGWEWRMLANLPRATICQFSQIVIELHSLGDLYMRPNASVARRAIQTLTRDHHVVHVHANNFGSFSVVGGLPVPDIIELTLARKDLGDYQPSDEVFPTKLDMPCYSERADLYLGRFLFD